MAKILPIEPAEKIENECEINSSHTTYLSDDDFDALLCSLENTDFPEKLEKLLQATPAWEK